MNTVEIPLMRALEASTPLSIGDKFHSSHTTPKHAMLVRAPDGAFGGSSANRVALVDTDSGHLLSSCGVANVMSISRCEADILHLTDSDGWVRESDQCEVRNLWQEPVKIRRGMRFRPSDGSEYILSSVSTDQGILVGLVNLKRGTCWGVFRKVSSWNPLGPEDIREVFGSGYAKLSDWTILQEK